MSDLSDRLRRLRRDPVGGGSPVPPGDDAPPGWLRRRLTASSKPESSRSESGEEPEGRDPVPVQLDSPELQTRAVGKTVGDPIRLVSEVTGAGELAFRELRYPEHHRHGDWRLSDVDHACLETLALVARDPACGALDLRRSIYLDVETTGLSGGAGTISFLVALGTFEAGEFRLWQGFLRSPAEEAALLADVARRIDDAESVVSFFGKSFDRHRLEDKMRLHGVEPPFSSKPHLDLYWPLQRLYGRGFGDGRLGTMETRLTGVERHDDLSGSFAPEAWFDYLSGRGHRLEDVFRHNRDDVLSLVVLAAHAGRSAAGTSGDGRPLSGPEGSRAAGLGRLFAAARRHAEALAWCERALAAGDVPDERGLRLALAELLVRTGATERALAELRALEPVRGPEAALDEVAARASVAAAKLLEHRFRDPGAALESCRRARRVALEGLTGRARARILRELERREQRLAEKVGAPAGPGSSAGPPRP